MNSWRSIGIVGGFGPRASSYFYRLLLDKCSNKYGSVFDSDYPKIFLASLASKGFTETGEIIDEISIMEINEAIAFFDNMNINIIAFPCNSIFAYYNKLRSINPNSEIINLPKVLAQSAAKFEAKKVVILCSQGLRDSLTYNKYFLEKNIDPFYPEESLQKIINQLIIEVMGNTYSIGTREYFHNIINDLSTCYDRVIIACTELSVMLDTRNISDCIIDSCNELANEALLRAYCNESGC